MRILQTLKRRATQDGDGVKISRIADFRSLRLDPFLMIDELKSDNQADFFGGFPPHPHRGIETFTYMLKGGFEHRDQLGNRKVISDGDVQWMSTGFGVIHSEMPVVEDDQMHGFQIWINMPASEKLRPARYWDSTQQPLVEITHQGVILRALAGDWELGNQTVFSPLQELAADAAIADVTLPKGAMANIDRREFDQVFVFVYRGEVSGLSEGELAIVDPQSPLILDASKDSGALIFSGNKLNEEIVHYGPFVMNTSAQIDQALRDYRDGKFGAITE